MTYNVLSGTLTPTIPYHYVNNCCTMLVVGRSGPSTDYYYGYGSNEMNPDRTLSSGRNYDGDAEQRRDNRRRSVQNEFSCTSLA